MQPVTKYTDNTANGGGNVQTYVTATTDYLFLLAEFEVFGTRSYANSYEQIIRHNTITTKPVIVE